MDLASGTTTRGSPRRDALALDALFERHNGYVLKRLYRHGVRNPADREDQAMNVWRVVVTRFDEFRGDAQVTTWLAEICWRVARDYRASAWHRRAHFAPDDAGEERAAQEQTATDADAVLEALQRLRELPPTLRDVVVRYYVEDHTAAEIAAELAMTPRQVYALLERAVARLRDNAERTERP